LVERPLKRQNRWRAGYVQGSDVSDQAWGDAGFGETGMMLARCLNLSLSSHQRQWLESFDKSWSRRVHLAPRAHGKTTIFGVLGMLSVIKKQPDSRILIISKTENIASNILSQTTRCARNLIEMGILPKFDGRPSGSKVRFEGNDNKEPSIFATGIDASITGMHFDWIICDDIIDDQNSSSPEQRDKVWDWFVGSLMNLSVPDTRMLVIGTRKHPDDLYGKLIADPAWSSAVEKAIIRYPANFEKALEQGQPIDRFFKFKNGRLLGVQKTDPGEVLWQEEWSIDRLLLERLVMGQTFFDREKQNDIRFFTGRVFKREWVHVWKELPPRESFSVYIGCDLAISKSDKADSFALAVVGKHDDKWLLLDLVVDKIGFARQAQVIREKTIEWKPLLVGIEDVAYQRALIEHLELEGGIPIASIKPNAPKESRIKALQPLFESGKVLVASHHENFIGQLAEFPSGKHDDMIDAFEMAVSLGNRGACLTLDFIGDNREGV
ncbi:MAG: phage terminase large subunit, partial [Caldiserica bacterium]|nr:phage terminase large subunit [Caldisericota bacterium]